MSELARELRVSKSLVFRVVRELEQRQFLTRQANRYRLGSAALALGGGLIHEASYAGATRSLLRTLARATSGNANLAVLRGAEVLYLVREASEDGARTDTQAGSRLPANCTALGKVLLSRLDHTELQTRMRSTQTGLTASSNVDAEALLAELARTRRRGFAVSHEEAFPGRACIAVHVRVPQLSEPAAVSLSTNAVGVTKHAPKILRALMLVRARIERG